jgi:hypothetical protein
MHFEIMTLILHDGVFHTLEDESLSEVDENYIHGAIVWTVNSDSILNISHWDLVDQLWAYLIEGCAQLLERNHFECGFPDQPLDIKLLAMEDGTSIKVTIGTDSHLVEFNVLFEALCTGGAEFFSVVAKRLPNLKSAAVAQLEKIRRIRERLASKGPAAGWH